MTTTTDATSNVDVVLVDTDVFSFLMKGHSLAPKYEKHVKGKKLALSFITVGELLTWPRLKGWGEAKTKELESRITRAGVIPYDELLCQTYADLRAQLHSFLRWEGPYQTTTCGLLQRQLGTRFR